MPLVVDASVAIKWFLNDETEWEQAQHVISDVRKNTVELILPSMFIYEVVNGFRVAVLKKRIRQSQAKLYTNELKEMKFPLVDCSFLVEEIVETAFEHNLSVYDATYVVCARYKQCDLTTGDKKLYNKTREKLPFVKWIGDY